MRRFFLVVTALAGTSAAASAQATNVVTSISRDSLRLMVERGGMTSGQIRALAASVKQASLRARELEMQAPRGNDERAVAARLELSRAWNEVLTAQSVLAMACAELRPREGRPDGYLGVTFVDSVTEVVRLGGATVKRFTQAPEISRVDDGSPAERAGVRRGDIWIGIAGRDLVGTSVGDVGALLKPGTRLELRFRRQGRDFLRSMIADRQPEYPSDVCDNMDEVVSVVPLVSRPRIEVFNFPGTERGMVARAVTAAFAGATFVSLTEEKREYHKAPPDEGVLVDHVTRGSLAEAAGLKLYDVLLRVNNNVITTPQDIARYLRPGAPAALWIIREGTPQGLTIGR